MSPKYFCLKWNSFQSNILSAFESLQNTEDLADVTLTCEGINLKAHKFILSACSPYFRTVFKVGVNICISLHLLELFDLFQKENPCSHPIVILKDVSHTDLIAIVNFMYHGEVTVSEEQLSSFLETAMILQVSGLINNTTSNETATPKKIPHESASVCKKKVQRSHESESHTTKRLKTTPKLRNFDEVPPHEQMNLENEKDKSKDVEEMVADVNENLESNPVDSKESSILEAALEVQKPSILERSLTQTKAAVIQVNPELNLSKSLYIPKKPPEIAEPSQVLLEKRPLDPTLPFDRPSEILLQSIKVEEESYEGSRLSAGSPPECENLPRNVDVQPHHSSQCGNCPHCGKVYSNQSSLKYHVRLVHSDLTNMYCCHLCPEAFDYREGYKKHMAEVHFIRN